LDPFIIKKNEERMKAEESLSRIMIRRNCAFSFFNDEDLQMLYSKAYPNLKVLFKYFIIIINFIYSLIMVIIMPKLLCREWPRISKKRLNHKLGNVIMQLLVMDGAIHQRLLPFKGLLK
jgi:hypothetical protein